MKIINIGILAHVDAGKTTLTESLLYTSGAIAEQGNVDKGTTRTDTMILEQQRGITIQTAVTSFFFFFYKINIVDTSCHMDFFTDASRALSVLVVPLATLPGSAIAPLVYNKLSVNVVFPAST